MSATIRIKKRAADGSAGAPSSLAPSELAFNENASDKKLYYGYGDDGSGEATSVIAIGGPGAFVDRTTAQSVAGDKTFSDNVIVSGNLTVGGYVQSEQPHEYDNLHVTSFHGTRPFAQLTSYGANATVDCNGDGVSASAGVCRQDVRVEQPMNIGLGFAYSGMMNGKLTVMADFTH